MTTQTQAMAATQATTETQPVKCLVWDLDRTLWDGVLLEDGRVALRRGAAEVVRALDGRGILQSIASKNDHEAAMAQLERFGLQEYFLYPQITWSAKSGSVQAIANSLNLALDAVALIDDEPYERDEVRHALPQVRCYDAADLGSIPLLAAFNPRFVTDDAKGRRLMYIADQRRNQAETAYEGPREDFLATLGMRVTIAEAQEADLMRAEELTVRTHQLNTTGITYSYEELDAFRRSDRHKLLIVQMEDRYGSYGRIGLALLECGSQAWTIRLLLMSCRVMTRGVGTIMINYLMRLARQAGRQRLRADFVANDRNRLMYVTYRFAGFKEIESSDGRLLLEHELQGPAEYPPYVIVQEGTAPCRAPQET